jgi:hypothetical protein
LKKEVKNGIHDYTFLLFELPEPFNYQAGENKRAVNLSINGPWNLRAPGRGVVYLYPQFLFM